jgi:hypothetical protein
MCTALLPPGGYPVAVNKYEYIISHQHILYTTIIFNTTNARRSTQLQLHYLNVCFHGVTVPNEPEPPDYRYFTITIGRTPLDEWSVRRWDLYLTAHNTHKRQTSMPTVGFEPAISASEWPQTHTCDRTATGSGIILIHFQPITKQHQKIYNNLQFVRISRYFACRNVHYSGTNKHG